MNQSTVQTDEVPGLCRSCTARHKGICGALTAAQLSELSRHTKQIQISAGTELQAEQQPIEKYAIVLNGVIKLSKLMEDGRQQIVGLQFAPDLLGRPFQAESNVSSEAATNAKLCVFSKSALERTISDSHQMASRLHEQTLRELDEAREWMLTLGRKTAYEKVASFLKLIATASDPESSGDGAPVRFTLPLTRAEMADFLGLTIETVSRQMTALRKNGLIEIERAQSITVRDLDRLIAVSGS